MNKRLFHRTLVPASSQPLAPDPGEAASVARPGSAPAAPPLAPAGPGGDTGLTASYPIRWRPAARSRTLATAALLALVAAILTGHAALVLLAAPALGALALMPRRRRPGELAVSLAVSGSRCFEGEDVTITATVRPAPASTDPGSTDPASTAPARPLDEITIQLESAPQVTLAAGDPARQTFAPAGQASARWVIRLGRWGRYSPGAIRMSCRDGLSGWETSLLVDLDPLEIFPRPTRFRPRLVPAELLRRIGEHTGRAVGQGVEFAGIRPYVPGDQLRDINRAVSIRRRQLHVNQRAAARAADLVVMIDAFAGSGPVSDATTDVAVHGAAALVTAYLRVSDRAGLVVLGGLLRWLAPAPGDRQFYRVAEMMLAARYDSFVTPDIGRIPRTALPPGTLVVVFSPLLDPRAFGAVTDLRQRGFPLIVVDTLQDEPPADPGSARAGLALRLWRLDRAATRSALRALGVPVLDWPRGTELDSVLAPLRQPPPGQRRAVAAPAARP
jgi:uncharacterized protein (DUF58 family)